MGVKCCRLWLTYPLQHTTAEELAYKSRSPSVEQVTGMGLAGHCTMLAASFTFPVPADFGGKPVVWHDAKASQVGFARGGDHSELRVVERGDPRDPAATPM